MKIQERPRYKLIRAKLPNAERVRRDTVVLFAQSLIASEMVKRVQKSPVTA